MGIDPSLAKALRTRLADVIAGAKAYDVPALCVRLGLEAGAVDEAMSSKFKYANSRLLRLGGKAMLNAARALLSEEPDFDLGEIVAKIDEHATPPVSTLTRRRILATFDGGPLCIEYDEIAFLEQIWPLAARSSVFDAPWSNGRSLRDDIIQHTIRNDDWTVRELLEHLGLIDCSRSLFFRFLEAAVHPTAVPDDTQSDRVQKCSATITESGRRQL